MKENNFFVGIKEVFDYIKNSTNYIFVIISFFFFFAFIGFFISLPEGITVQIFEYFQELIKQTQGYDLFEMSWFLFENNVFVSFLGVLGGILFGGFSLFSSIMNGFVLGFASKVAVLQNGVFSLWRLFPHGIFELPALFLSLGLGFRLGAKFFEKHFNVKGIFNQTVMVFFIMFPVMLVLAIFYLIIGIYTNILIFLLIMLLINYFLKKKDLKNELKLSLNTFLYIVVPLLIIAAIIEAFLITA